MYLLKLKAYKFVENSDAGLSWLLFLKKPTCRGTIPMTTLVPRKVQLKDN